jgi:ABC-type dipeptide/oligopeptide/nickel transport system ATPase component
MRMHWPLLHVSLSIDYPARPLVLNEASFEVRPGEIVGLVGSSGSGKSSLALAVLRLLEFKGGRARGTVWFKGTDLLRLPERAMRGLRGKELAFVPQSPTSFLNPAVRIFDQMAEAWRAHQSGSSAAVAAGVADAIAQVGLPTERSFLKRFPGEISVGQAQRVLIAMAVLHRPSLLIADEPTSSLDLISQAEILRLLSRLNRTLGMGILYISHDLLSIAGFCHRVAILDAGQIVEFAETAAIFERPQHPYTRQLIAALPTLPHLEKHLAPFEKNCARHGDGRDARSIADYEQACIDCNE